MSRTVIKVTKAIHPNSVWILIVVGNIGPQFFTYLFMYFQFRFVISIFKNLQLSNIKYIKNKERCTSMLQRDIKKL